jgi:hypothetical protein
MGLASILHNGRTWDGVARLEVRAFGGRTPESPLTVSLTRHAPDSQPPTERDLGLLNNHLMAVDGKPYANNYVAFLRASQTSSAVVAFVDRDEAPDLVVDRLLSQLPVTSAAGAIIDDHTCRVGLRTRGHEWPGGDDGRLTTVSTTAQDAPIELFPATLLGWSFWWRREARELRGRPVTSDELPPPPKQLVLQENGHSYPIQMEGWERTEWPDPPRRPADDGWNEWVDPDSG